MNRKKWKIDKNVENRLHYEMLLMLRTDLDKLRYKFNHSKYSKNHSFIQYFSLFWPNIYRFGIFKVINSSLEVGESGRIHVQRVWSFRSWLWFLFVYPVLFVVILFYQTIIQACCPGQHLRTLMDLWRKIKIYYCSHYANMPLQMSKQDQGAQFLLLWYNIGRITD